MLNSQYKGDVKYVTVHLITPWLKIVPLWIQEMLLSVLKIWKSDKDDSQKDEKTFEIVEGGNCPDFTVSPFLVREQPKT